MSSWENTKNQNEALNKMIWEIAPKDIFIGLQEIETATFDAIANSNIGATARINFLKSLGIDPGQYSMEGCHRIDIQQVKSAEYKEKNDAKKRRKVLRGRKKKRIDAIKELE